MKSVKAIFLTLLALTATLGAYIFFKFDTQYSAKLVQDAYLNQDPVAFEKHLDAIKGKPISKLYLGYQKRDQGDFNGSNEAFKAYLKQIEPKHKLEAEQNLILNSYLSEDYNGLKDQLAHYKKDDHFYHFFNALYQSAKGNHKETLKEFKQTSYPISDFHCLKSSINQNLDRGLKDEKIIFANIQLGNFDTAKDLVKSHTSGPKATISTDQANFYLGFCDIMEGALKPAPLCYSYYKNAFKLIAKLPAQDSDYSKYFDDFSRLYTEAVCSAVKNSFCDEAKALLDYKESYDIDYLAVVSLLKETLSTTEVAAQFTTMSDIDKVPTKALNAWKLLLTLSCDSTFKKVIDDVLSEEIERDLGQGDLKALCNSYGLYKSIGIGPCKFDDEILNRYKTQLDEWTEKQNFSSHLLPGAAPLFGFFLSSGQTEELYKSYVSAITSIWKEDLKSLKDAIELTSCILEKKFQKEFYSKVLTTLSEKLNEPDAQKNENFKEASEICKQLKLLGESKL